MTLARLIAFRRAVAPQHATVREVRVDGVPKPDTNRGTLRLQPGPSAWSHRHGCLPRYLVSSRSRPKGPSGKGRGSGCNSPGGRSRRSYSGCTRSGDRSDELCRASSPGAAAQKNAEATEVGAPQPVISLPACPSEPDSRSTSGRGSGVVGYNVQVAVDTEHHPNMAHEVTNSG